MTLPMRALVFAAVAVVAAAAFVALSQGSLFRNAAVTYDRMTTRMPLLADFAVQLRDGPIGDIVDAVLSRPTADQQADWLV
jgi:hypothetical protein